MSKLHIVQTIACIFTLQMYDSLYASRFYLTTTCTDIVGRWFPTLLYVY